MAEKLLKRNSAIELLRIVAMLMIVAHHFVYYGVQQHYDVNIVNNAYYCGTYLNKCIAQLLLPGGIVGVALFFVIAGYYGIQSDKISLARVVFNTVFYAFFGLMLYIVLYKGGGIKSIVRGIFPLASSTYWFVSVYVMVLLMKSAINRFVNWLDIRKAIIFVILSIGYYAVVRAVIVPYLGVVIGVNYYIVGALIKRYESEIKLINLNWMIVGLAGWIGYVVFSNIVNMRYVSVFCNLFAICVMGFISTIGFFLYFLLEKDFLNLPINKIAKSTLAVYLIHEHPMLREFLWEKIFHVASVQWQSNYFALYAILSIIGVFMFGILVDMIKDKVIIKFMRF